MSYDFDTLIERRSSHSTKWSKFGEDVLPMWVADMDFAAPDFILEALRTRLEHPILGYTDRPQSLTDAFIDWLAFHYGWHVEEDWLVFIPGVVPGLNIGCQIDQPGALMVPTPVYHPFLDLARHAGRAEIRVPMARRTVQDAGGTRQQWVMDFDAMQEKVSAETRLLAICNPQNPTGRCYDAAELAQLAEFVEVNDLILLSDDIHGSIVLREGVRHVPIAHAQPQIAARTISLFAPTKAYNVPGISSAVAVIPDEELRMQFLAARKGILPGVGPLGFTVTEAAFRDRGSWLPELTTYLRHNAQRVDECLGERVAWLDATYLAWIDVGDLGERNMEAHFAAHGLGISPGAQFGETSHIRLNFGCSRTTLDEGLHRLQNALK
ncbi:MAG: PatB family C-S lyase [Pseudomonadales bacterium]